MKQKGILSAHLRLPTADFLHIIVKHSNKTIGLPKKRQKIKHISENPTYRLL
jgi:hypothetical protein